MAKRKSWTKTIAEHGVEVRLFDRGGTIYRRVIGNGRKDRKSSGHSDRALAEQQVKSLCAELAKHRIDGTAPGGVTFGQLRNRYLLQRVPILSATRRHFMTGTLELLGLALEGDGQAFQMDDLTQDHVDAYVAA